MMRSGHKNVFGPSLFALVIGAAIFVAAAPSGHASFELARTIDPQASVNNVARRVPSLTSVVAAAPVGLPLTDPVTAVAAGHRYSLALTRGGQVYAWGANATGQLGAGCASIVRCITPLLVEGLPAGDPVTAIAAGYGHSLAVTRLGRVYAWGDNTSGQLGNGSVQGNRGPVTVEGLPGSDPVVAVAASYVHSVALTRSGRVFAWGGNRFGQVGQDGATVIPLPKTVPGLPAGDPVVAIAAGAAHTLALTRAGRVYAWGDQGTGQLGAVTNGAHGAPVEVSDLPPSGRVSALAAGSIDGLAVLRAGEVYAWGDNGFGQLGHLDVGYFSSIPVVVQDVPRADHATSVAAGDYFSLALTRSGHIYAWGQNNDGQLGAGNNLDAGTAVAVPGQPFGDRVVAVAAGGAHSLAVTANGRVYAWGQNDDGQLGDGTTRSSDVPLQVGRAPNL